MGQARKRKQLKNGTVAKSPPKAVRPAIVPSEPQSPPRPSPVAQVKHFKWILAAMLMVSAATKLWHLSDPPTYYFDEVYHSFTAGLYLHGDPKAYDPWAKPPQGRAHEWTHPPLSKTLMAITMGIFGEDSFGWRIGSLIFNMGAIWFAAQIALDLFSSQRIALLAVFFMSVETLMFAQARIGMNDSYFIFFALFTIRHYLRWKDVRENKTLLKIGLGLGCAAATKWTALYLFGVLGIDMLRDHFWIGGNKRFRNWGVILLAMGVLPVAIYIASYFQMFLMGNSFARWWSVQQQMWWYHSKLKATHTYQSVPWQWIFNLRPVWFHGFKSDAGYTGNIYNLGNSVVLIAGLGAALWSTLKEQTATWNRWFILLCYFMFWVPWSFSPRIMLFYHYLPAVPFLCIVLARQTDRWLTGGDIRYQRCAYALLGASLLWFAVFYPHATGIRVPKEFADAVYFGVRSWK